ncbi:MAG: carbohydrate ABC transporter permease [Spirochaetales bacterium]|nr:carbohydrate ABC transporter permease [Spirochaetales bacterium]
MSKEKVFKFVIHLFLIFSLLVCLYPFFYMVNNSLKTGMEIMNYPFNFPEKVNYSGYVQVFSELNIVRLFLNSTFIALSVTILNLVFNSMAAYSLEKTQFKYKDVLFKFILFTMMIPGVILLIPTYIFLFRLGWKNTYRVLIIPGALSAYNIFLFKQFFQQIDNAYVESAKIDGANHFQIYSKIILPMAIPVLSTVAILCFMGSWNDFMGPLLWINDEALYTLQLGITKFRSLIPGTNLQTIYASITFATVPVVLFYMLFQNQFVKAYTGVSLK